MSGIIPRLLPGEHDFPEPDQALRIPDGLLAVGADLQPETLLCAYRSGIFPWNDDEDINLWWCPDPRSVLFPEEMHISHSLCRTLRRETYRLSTDSAFDAVIAACADARSAGTWISTRLQHSFLVLHNLGLAHSVEVWKEDALVGGLYGLALGHYFCGESMFSLHKDASKVALAHLCVHLHRANFPLIDCQIHNTHLESLGACTIARTDFLQKMKQAQRIPATPGPWRWPPVPANFWHPGALRISIS